MNAETLMLIGGIAAFALTAYWVRSRELRERYAVGWMLLATGLLACGVFPQIIIGFAESSRLSYPAAVLFIALTVLYVFCFLMTVALTRQHRCNVRLMQETAILKSWLRELEARLGDKNSAE
jgi:hypothetical protein